AVHHETLALAKAAREVLELMEPDEEEHPLAIAEHDLEHAPPTPPREALMDARHLAHRGRLLADPQLGESLERAAVLAAERQVIEEVLDCPPAKSCQVGGALRPDRPHRL